MLHRTRKVRAAMQNDEYRFDLAANPALALARVLCDSID
jgi:hypothetical protein